MLPRDACIRAGPAIWYHSRNLCTDDDVGATNLDHQLCAANNGGTHIADPP